MARIKHSLQAWHKARQHRSQIEQQACDVLNWIVGWTEADLSDLDYSDKHYAAQSQIRLQHSATLRYRALQAFIFFLEYDGTPEEIIAARFLAQCLEQEEEPQIRAYFLDISLIRDHLSNPHAWRCQERYVEGHAYLATHDDDGIVIFEVMNLAEIDYDEDDPERYPWTGQYRHFPWTDFKMPAMPGSTDFDVDPLYARALRRFETIGPERYAFWRGFETLDDLLYSCSTGLQPSDVLWANEQECPECHMIDCHKVVCSRNRYVYVED